MNDDDITITPNWGQVAEDVADFMNIHGTVGYPGKRHDMTTELSFYLQKKYHARLAKQLGLTDD